MWCAANAQDIAWGIPNINKTGETLFNYLLGEILSAVNKCSESTFVTSNKKHF